jgi:hypothetical protein
MELKKELGSHTDSCEKVGCCMGCFKSNQFNYCAECYSTLMPELDADQKKCIEAESGDYDLG